MSRTRKPWSPIAAPAESRCDALCPGFMWNREAGHIERCDECGTVDSDGAAASAVLSCPTAPLRAWVARVHGVRGTIAIRADAHRTLVNHFTR